MMLQNTVHFTHWGNSAHVEIPERFLYPADAYTLPIDYLCRAIARKNRGLEVADCRRDCTAVDRRGHALSTHYELTIGKPLRTGGYSVRGRVWVSMKHKDG